ncbi:DNA translocase FtsK [Bacillus sp. S13(2024)]|uniref:DNA translocase FtsK n=1 Tax=unclassified Bacillus (in: firmicutes) TaxID=185979 RepID=UPI003D1B694D
MLDWMKKLFKKEEENEATVLREIETPVEKKVTSHTPRVNYYSNKREDELQVSKPHASKNFRFPLIPDGGFEENTMKSPRIGERAIQEIPIRERRQSRRVEEIQKETRLEPIIQEVTEAKPTSVEESHRRPFRPTEVVSPIFGYKRPEVGRQEHTESRKQQREDIEISIEGKAVVDAWFEKNGYAFYESSQDVLPEQNQVEFTRIEANAKQEKAEVKKSVVDTWLEKNEAELAPVQNDATFDEAVLHNREAEQVNMREEAVVLKGDSIQQIHSFENEAIAAQGENELHESIAVETEFEMKEEVERIEEPVIQEDTLKVEEPEETKEVELSSEMEESDVQGETPEVEEFEETKEVELSSGLEESDVQGETPEVEEFEETKEVELSSGLEESDVQEATLEAEEFEETKGVELSSGLEESDVQGETPEVEEFEETKEVELSSGLEESDVQEATLEAEEFEETEEVEISSEMEESDVQGETPEVEEFEETEEVEISSEMEESDVQEAEEFEETEEVELSSEVEESDVQEAIQEAEEFEETEEVELSSEMEESDVQEATLEAEEFEETKEVEVSSEMEGSDVQEAEEFEETEEVELSSEMEESDVQEAIQEAEEFEETEEVELSSEMEESDVQEATLEAEEFEEIEEVEVSSEMEESDVQEATLEAEEFEEIEEVELSSEMEESYTEEIFEAEEFKEVFSITEEVLEANEAEAVVTESFVQEQSLEPIQANEQTQQAVQAFVNVLIEETEEKQNTIAEQNKVKTEQRKIDSMQEPKREKKRFVPFNVVMLKQDKQMLEAKRRAAMPPQPAPSHNVTEQKQNMEPPAVKQPVQEEMTHRVVVETEQDIRNVLQAPPTYEFPPLTLLNIPSHPATNDAEWLEEQKELLNTTFHNFHVGAKVVNVTQGPAVTRFEVQPEPGVKVNKITNLSDDIKLNLAARDIRIEAPIPGKSAVGIEVPNKESKAVFLREILRSPVFTKSESPLTVALGLDISGTPIVTDIRKMPHGLIAGATGSGKSVCINAILTSILYKAKPHEVKLMLIDPKMVELAPYNSVPHLVAPVITDVKAATAALKWAVEEMERRYELFAHAGARDLTRYNTIMNEQEIPGETLPYIVIVIDELADLMMVAPGDVEEAICRIAQKARACGIHLLVATQRPSVDVITGLIKSNIPTRIAFTVSSQVDSRTIIDIGGAEKLLGRGDMLFLDNGTSKPVRVQGVYVSDEEIEKSVAHAKRQMKPNYLFHQEDLLAKTEQQESEDELFFEACQFVVEQGGASTSSVQRRFRIGYNRAARLIEDMEAQGIISEARGTKPRDVLITEDEFAAMQDIHV